MVWYGMVWYGMVWYGIHHPPRGFGGRAGAHQQHAEHIARLRLGDQEDLFAAALPSAEYCEYPILLASIRPALPEAERLSRVASTARCWHLPPLRLGVRFGEKEVHKPLLEARVGHAHQELQRLLRELHPHREARTYAPPSGLCRAHGFCTLHRTSWIGRAACLARCLVVRAKTIQHHLQAPARPRRRAEAGMN